MGNWKKPDLGVADKGGLDKDELVVAVHQGRVVSQGDLGRGLDEEAPIDGTDFTVESLQRRAVDAFNRAHLLSSIMDAERGPDVPSLPEDDDHTIQ